ncbi:hypothetical protein [Chryseolinea sp. H1M3-3]|uniref:hypothetical protein n=1 Tax=Chryseolinea sp. H1M3-3 TaxID=3034144 RepID=UPI0023EC6181|nr:hypothetical protein [Chryseolinea sp. H1M3-3]
MAIKMLEYCKTILQKISFNKRLFKKEYKKTFKYLTKDEHLELKKWLKSQLNGTNTRMAKAEVITRGKNDMR